MNTTSVLVPCVRTWNTSYCINVVFSLITSNMAGSAIGELLTSFRTQKMHSGLDRTRYLYYRSVKKKQC